MKKEIIVAAILAVCLVGCGNSPPVEEPHPEPEKPIAKETYQDIEEIFSGVCEGASVEVWDSPTRLEVHILTEKMSSRNPPETWDATVSALENALAAGLTVAQKYSPAMLTAQIEDDRGTIYASGYNGVVKFDYPNKLKALRPKDGEFPLQTGYEPYQSDYEYKYFDGSTDFVESNGYVGIGVYITETGAHYHYDPNCNQGTYFPSTLNEAQSLGLTPCKKCIG